MSKETIEWLNQNTLIGNVVDRDLWTHGWGGFRDDRFQAWWQQPGYTGAYDGPIPVDEIERRLFYWEPLETTINVELPIDPEDDPTIADSLNAAGVPVIYQQDPSRKAIVRPDTGQVLNIVGADSYQVHNYRTWLIDNVGQILDVAGGDLGASSAGLLRGGGVAYVTIEAPDTIRLGNDDGIRPAIVAATSLDSTLATTYKKTVNRPLCDNSLTYSLRGFLDRVKIRHSSKSLNRIDEVRATLEVFFESTAEDVAFFEAIANETVTDDEWRQIVDRLVPVPDEQMSGGKVLNQRAVTNAKTRQADLWRMWGHDPRVGNHLRGTLAGAYMAVNTWQQHERPRTTNQVERTMTGMLDGAFSRADDEFWAIIDQMDDIKVPVIVA